MLLETYRKDLFFIPLKAEVINSRLDIWYSISQWLLCKKKKIHLKQIWFYTNVLGRHKLIFIYWSSSFKLVLSSQSVCDN